MRIDTLLNDESQPLGKLIQQARMLAAVTARLKQWLPPELAQECCVATYEAGVLIVLVRSAAFLTPLRFHQGTLLHTLRQDPTWCHLRQLTFKVASPLHTLPL